MSYRPRPAFAATCAHCGVAFEAQHLATKYCSTPCNALATHARRARQRAPLEAELAATHTQVTALRDELAALRDEVAAVRDRLPPEPDFEVPRGVRARVGLVRRQGPPRFLDPMETDYPVPRTRQVQRYVAPHAVGWRAREEPDYTYRARGFWVGDDASLWVENNEGSVLAVLVHVDECVG